MTSNIFSIIDIRVILRLSAMNRAKQLDSRSKPILFFFNSDIIPILLKRQKNYSNSMMILSQYQDSNDLFLSISKIYLLSKMRVWYYFKYNYQQLQTMQDSKLTKEEICITQQQASKETLKEKVNSLCLRIYNFLECIRIFSQKQLQSIQQASFQYIQQTQLTNDTARTEVDQREIPLKSYEGAVIKKVKRKYMESYAQSLSERKKNFLCSFEFLESHAESQFDKKGKNFFGELKRLIFCYGGNELEEIQLDQEKWTKKKCSVRLSKKPEQKIKSDTVQIFKNSISFINDQESGMYKFDEAEHINQICKQTKNERNNKKFPKLQHEKKIDLKNIQQYRHNISQELELCKEDLSNVDWKKDQIEVRDNTKNLQLEKLENMKISYCQNLINPFQRQDKQQERVQAEQIFVTPPDNFVKTQSNFHKIEEPQAFEQVEKFKLAAYTTGFKKPKNKVRKALQLKSFSDSTNLTLQLFNEQKI